MFFMTLITIYITIKHIKFFFNFFLIFIIIIFI